MTPKINKQLLPLKIHYFFKYGGIAFFPLLPVVVRQKGITESGVGLIWTITPLLSCIVNLMCSALADRFKIYRSIFLTAMAIFSFSFLSIFFLADTDSVPMTPTSQCFTRETPLDMPSWLFFQECGNTTLSAWLKEVGLGGESSCVLHCNHSSEIQAELSNSTVFHVPVQFKTNWPHSEMDLYDICFADNWTAVHSTPGIDTDLNISSTHLSNPCQVIATDVPCTYTCKTLADVLTTPVFWLIFILLVIVYGGNACTTTIADTICFSLLGSARYKYGQQRMWGSVGWGLVGSVSGALVDVFSRGKATTNYLPALIISAIFFAVNYIVSINIPFKMPDKEKLKASNVGKALCSSQLLIYLTTVVVGGLNMGLVWTFLFIVVEDVAVKWDPDFHHQKLLQGLMLGTQCFLGEVPSLFLSALIIKKLGSIRTFALALVGFSARVLLYSFVTNPWWFIPIDLLHGLSFGVFYPNMISYASLVAPKGAQATVQGIVKSLFVVGVSLGSLVGGILVTVVGGSTAFFYLCLFDLVYTLLFIVVQLCMYKRGQRADGQGDYSTTDGVDPMKKKGLNIMLGVEEQASMCDLQVAVPYSEVVAFEEEEALQDKTDI
ncbi:hypothetical protein Pmani_026852 [Petrolisthes manimaculis]|uniref:Major facilitator superfamily (MFS) profile domain-containing protein n=1 Tax=Petrolisthes manimaculis TaxID=1843537 RepID=A0AAE1TZP9_9EUCA|nr:hypothetical protein Pmani_026852 [Petrolisthes manimaculis]